MPAAGMLRSGAFDGEIQPAVVDSGQRQPNFRLADLDGEDANLIADDDRLVDAAVDVEHEYLIRKCNCNGFQSRRA